MWVSELANRWLEATPLASIPTQMVMEEGKTTGGGKGIAFRELCTELYSQGCVLRFVTTLRRHD